MSKEQPQTSTSAGEVQHKDVPLPASTNDEVNTSRTQSAYVIHFNDKSVSTLHLSNDYNVDMMIDGTFYHCVTAYIYSKEYKVEENIAANKHMKSQSSTLCCRISRGQNPLRNATETSIQVHAHMCTALAVNFTSNGDLSSTLCSLNESAIVYDSDDCYWG